MGTSKNPVDFITAVKALDSGETIYVECSEETTYVFSPIGNQSDWGVSMKQQYGHGIDTELILNGKWYIED